MTLGVALTSPGLLAEMYKWVDDQGQVQYSQSPPPGRPAQTIEPPPKVDSKAARDKLKQQLQDFEVRGDKRQEQAEADQKTKEQADERKAACESARERLTRLESNPRILRVDKDESRTRLTEGERQTAIAEARKKIEEHCESL
ncbi:MAG: DUF4124 domain-containing protein [Gammaproteobacteria bacterium]